ncbi:MAG: aminomethyl-transferring glycine dehydrogenase subunit GcvPB [Bauldia sp.]|nr:aminomethyl-transferring glycine dehydrogenase subunit GcvPB [Bauldia sp.]
MLNTAERSRPTQPAPISADDVEAVGKARGIRNEEPLIFEVGRAEVSGVDLPEPETVTSRLGGLERKTELGLPGLSEPEALRHYVRLSKQNYAIDINTYPLGSCTMKHNARLNEKMARLPGFGDIHPLQPLSTVQGAVDLMQELSHWLMTLTGMEAIALSPKAGAHGELCGMMAIKTALAARGEDATRTTVLAPQSAHGTNPATAAVLGYRIESIPARADGTVDPEVVKAKLGPHVAAIMLTNPNTCGLFEPDIIAIADAVHAAGAFFYCDGANLNAILGKVRPGELGVDAMHINLHKTLSTPHGGGGPGSGPVVLSATLAPYAPVPFIRMENGAPVLIEESVHALEGEQPFGRMTAFHGQMGMYVRALAYLLSHGEDGVKSASETAVLNANYVRVGLRDVMTQPFGDRICMHEALFDDRFLEPHGVTTLDFAKAMIDEGYHPMTMYFPLVVHGALLIEPTESESKESLDQFIETMRGLAARAKAGDAASFKTAPHFAPRRRLDETRAARQPRLRWRPAT